MLQEAKDIVSNIQDGNLPASELPGFIFYLVGKTFWFWFLLIVGGIAGFLIGK